MPIAKKKSTFIGTATPRAWKAAQAKKALNSVKPAKTKKRKKTNG
jgi:hypothetical protein